MPGRFAEPSNPRPRPPPSHQPDHPPPKSYAAAAAAAFDTSAAASPLEPESPIDVDAIKESPPRSNSDGSAPRPLGEILDEDEELHGSPRPVTPTPATRTTTTIPGQSFADAAANRSSSYNHHHRQPSEHSADGDYDRHSVSTDGSQKSPLRRVTKRIPSHTLNGGTRREVSDSMSSPSASIVHEKFDGKHGEGLTTVKPRDALSNGVSETRPPLQQKHSRRYSRDDLVSGRKAGESWGQSPIRWAPLNVPLQRRLQTLMVLVHTLSIALFVSVFFALCSVPILWPIIVPYLIYVLFSNAASSGNLSHRSPFLRSLPIWSLFASYFPARLHRTTTLPPTRKYLFGYHPHGIISHGAFAAFATEALGFSQLFPGITNTLLTLDSNFRIPLYRDYALRMGLGSVSRESCENILSKGGPNGEGMGRAITIVVGGAAESLDARPNSLKLILRRRKGFVKLAIRTGADLVPVLAFGENELYEQVKSEEHPRIHSFQMFVKKVLGFTVPLFHARGVFNYDVGLLPYRRPVNIVVGRPIMVEQRKNPDPEYVDRIHRRYMDELQGIFDEWKDQFAGATKAIELVE